jgi:hypothetical protein
VVNTRSVLKKQQLMSRSIALQAAFLAVDARDSVGMAHTLTAARSEYAKMERPLAPRGGDRMGMSGALMVARVPAAHAPARRAPGVVQHGVAPLSGPAPGPRWSFGNVSVYPKLPIGAVDDPQEYEADRIAGQVMRMPGPGIDLSAPPALPAVRRMCAGCEEEEKKLQRKCSACEAEDAKVNRAPSGAAAATGSFAPASVHGVLSSPGNPMDADTRAFFEPRFGRDLGHVRLHTDLAAAESAQDVGARAYTVGSNIVLGLGQFDSHSTGGRWLLAHELAHVVQSESAIARPMLRRTTHGPGTPTNCHNWKIPLPPWIAGTIAHGQISTTLKIPPHSIPRASKVAKGIPAPPPITPLGFADLWTHGAGALDIAEIKSTATGGIIAADEAKHYIMRHDEWLARETSGTADARDAVYLADVGAPIPGAPLDLGAITGSDLNLGPFWGDPAKQLHMEGDPAGAVVYWCTGGGTTVSPLWLIALKKALDALAKKLKAAKDKLQEAAAKVGEALGRIAKAIRSALLPLLVVLLVLAIVALLVIAIICVFGAPETLGLSLVCTALGLAGAVTAAVALLLLIGVPVGSGLADATASVFRASNPDIAAAEPEGGPDYERNDEAAAAAPITSATSASAAITAFNPGDDFLAALNPIADQLSDPVGFIATLTGKLANLDSTALTRLNDAVAALENTGDTATAGFIRSAIKNSGLDQPGALAAKEIGPAGEANAVTTAAAAAASGGSPASLAAPEAAPQEQAAA